MPAKGKVPTEEEAKHMERQGPLKDSILGTGKVRWRCKENICGVKRRDMLPLSRRQRVQG